MTGTSGDEPKLRVAVAGATGYAGAGCVELLQRHPGVDLVQVGSRSQAGRRHQDVYPGSACPLELTAEVDGVGCDVVISALPPGEAARAASGWLGNGAVVIDVAADFRLRDTAAYRIWYGQDHPAPELLGQAVLAMPELQPGAISGASLLALPGCFSTAAILACGPAAMSGLVEPEVVVDAKTGTSGAGRQADSGHLFSELNESVRAYSVAGHRHRPEMEQALSQLAGADFGVTFVPHLTPMTRGIVATCYLRPRPGVGLEQLLQAYRQRYQGAPFVSLVGQAAPSKLASHTNLCFISLQIQGPHLVACAVLDNLGRGASSQAVQVLNQRFGMELTAGLGGAPQWP
ncbi:MAG: N-acetyl-gamma-glutamyl-phosphate reductase [Candidatus Dormibacteria bacterium]